MLELKALLIALSIAALLTAVFVFRFRTETNHWITVGYFAFILAAEWAAGHWIIPPDAVPIIVAPICLIITMPIIMAIRWTRKHERLQDH